MEHTDCVAIDFETSGNSADCACAVGMVRVTGGVLTETFYHLIRPPNPYVMYTRIHGLTWAQLRDQPTFGELWPLMARFLDGAPCLTAHNAAFDRRVLTGCLAALGRPPLPQPFLCTLKGARRAWKLPHNTLEDLCRHCGIELRHHHAGSDAQAAARIYLRLLGCGLRPADMQLR